MFIDFLFELRRHNLHVSIHEWNALLHGLALGLHHSSLQGFYRLARSLCVKDISEMDAFDAAFLSYFEGVEGRAADLEAELLAWLRDPRRRAQLSEEERRLLETLDLEQLRQLFEKRRREQKKRHDGGNYWIGTGGTSPFGAGGQHSSGLRLGAGGGRSAMQVAAERRFRPYRKDHVLDVRQIDVALRQLRRLGREGAAAELDLDETIDATCRNGGELELVERPPRRNRLKLLLLMDVGGSMDPYANLVGRLFTAASRSGRFARFRSFFFHNCIYGRVYHDAAFREPVSVADLLHQSDREERLVVVGDALMHPAELLDAGGSTLYVSYRRTPGIEWLRRLAAHFRRSAWLSPEPRRFWPHTTIELIAAIFPMWELTLEGLEEAVRHLVRGGAGGPAVTPATGFS